jgi:hypothetical protein
MQHIMSELRAILFFEWSFVATKVQGRATVPLAGVLGVLKVLFT